MIRCMFLSYPISLANIGVCVFCVAASMVAFYNFGGEDKNEEIVIVFFNHMLIGMYIADRTI